MKYITKKRAFIENTILIFTILTIASVLMLFNFVSFKSKENYVLNEYIKFRNLLDIVINSLLVEKFKNSNLLKRKFSRFNLDIKIEDINTLKKYDTTYNIPIPAPYRPQGIPKGVYYLKKLTVRLKDREFEYGKTILLKLPITN